MEFFGEVGGGNPYKPSLFELVAQEQLRDLLQPALKYVLSVSPRVGSRDRRSSQLSAQSTLGLRTTESKILAPYCKPS